MNNKKIKSININIFTPDGVGYVRGFVQAVQRRFGKVCRQTDHQKIGQIVRRHQLHEQQEHHLRTHQRHFHRSFLFCLLHW